MPIPTWIRDLLGIRLDILAAKKSKLEIEKLEHEAEKREQSILVAANQDDIAKYDPSTQLLLLRISEKYASISRATKGGGDPPEVTEAAICMLQKFSGEYESEETPPDN